ncbi:MAG: cellulase family glycosylhydrolase [Lachnospiraceae bacterium]|nr:cellulase family glycosylhydrolase [Lachnospiraceae bacterium]
MIILGCTGLVALVVLTVAITLLISGGGKEKGSDASKEDTTVLTAETTEDKGSTETETADDKVASADTQEEDTESEADNSYVGDIEGEIIPVGGSPVSGTLTPAKTTPTPTPEAQRPEKPGEEPAGPGEGGDKPSKPGDKKGYTLTYGTGNSWQDGSTSMYGVEWEISNNGGKNVEGWTLKIDIEGLAKAEGWNGSFKCEGHTLTITNADYNGSISNGSSVYCGCNLGVNAGKLKITKASLNGVDMTVTEGKVDQNAQNNQNNGGNNNGNSNNNNGNNNNNGQANTNPSELIKRPQGAKQGDDWLHTDGRRILDSTGKEVWLTGLNWFGYNTGTNTFDGLWNSQLAPTVKAIADHGFNLIRVPMSAQLINEWAAGTYPRANYNNAYNPELNSMNSLEIFEYFLALAEENGIKVMIDIHSAETDASGHNVNLWYTTKVSADNYLAALAWAAERYKNNDTIIAFDLKNEPHGKPNEGKNAAIWNDSKDANNWKYMAERAALTVLDKNPNVLVMVEGIEIYPKDIKGNKDYHSTSNADYHFNWWGGNLRGVKDFPVNLGKYQNKLVYSPHDYGPTVYEQPWFEGKYTYDSLMKDCWHDNWFYIYEDNTAPLLIGEWGGFMREPNLTWMTYMRQLISKYHLNHTFWCLNANSGDTGGLLLDDFTTWDDEKYKFVKEVLWQENGKFVGLDHSIALGANGISVSNAKGIK